MKKLIPMGMHAIGVTIDPKNSDIPLNVKQNISEYNIQEIRGWTIDKLNEIEEAINQLIILYFKPEKEAEFRSIILNSSIINSGAKAKILNNLPEFDNKLINNFQRIVSIRNAFAHSAMTNNAVVKIENVGGEIKFEVESLTSHLEVMNSSGQLKTNSVKDLVEEYSKRSDEIVDSLNQIIRKTADNNG
ncbi:hypothetical protein [Flavobacterium undicola]|uniref:hypothetical protein n=1 Tax=Flavobacterium undicola TaxID=1932779 RepID=UPI00137743DA|nr:hypothetical protein [Flavobacterium undicola]MBA0882753.1 hypothetical protein [Flavobacterium undicola]